MIKFSLNLANESVTINLQTQAGITTADSSFISFCCGCQCLKFLSELKSTDSEGTDELLLFRSVLKRYIK